MVCLPRRQDYQAKARACCSNNVSRCPNVSRTASRRKTFHAGEVEVLSKMMPFLGKGFSFQSNSADGSFVGTFEGVTESALCFTENGAVDFVRTFRPDLYQKLNGLPVATFETPEDFNTHRKPHIRKRKFVEDKENVAPVQDGQAAASGLRLKDRMLTTPSNTWRPSQQRLLELQHKRYLQRQLLSKQSIFLRESGTNASQKATVFYYRKVQNSTRALVRIPCASANILATEPTASVFP